MSAKNEHVWSEDYEQEIIRLANSFPGLKHSFDDCGRIHASFCGIERFLIPVDKPDAFSEIPNEKFLNAMISAQLNKNIPPADYKNFLSRLNDFLLERKLSISKGNTTFVNGKPYAVLVLTRGCEWEKKKLVDQDCVLLGTIDAYVEGRHFRKEENATPPGFYAACAAASDIGANGGSILYLDLTLVNPGEKAADFMEEVFEAAEFFKVPRVTNGLFDDYELAELGEFTALISVIGKVQKKKEMTLQGLEEGMSVYVAGRAGISRAADYYVPKEHLMYNLNPEFRQKVFKAIKSKAVCNDVSDGVDKSLNNLLRYNTGLDINIDSSKLMLAANNPFGLKVTVDDILYGGDDYSLVIATKSELKSIEGVVRIGEVIRGNKKINYY